MRRRPCTLLYCFKQRANDLSASVQRQVQARYETHRQTRNKQQRAKLLDPDFKGADIDQVLYKLLHPEEHPGYRDPRYCLVFWARPTEAVKGLIGRVQARLNKVLPGEANGIVIRANEVLTRSKISG